MLLWCAGGGGVGYGRAFGGGRRGVVGQARRDAQHVVQDAAGIADAVGFVGAGVGQRFVQGVENQLVDGLAVAEADFGFGRVDVGVDLLGR